MFPCKAENPGFRTMLLQIRIRRAPHLWYRFHRSCDPPSLLFIGESLILSQSDQIAAERNIVLCHIHTDTESLKRGTPGIIYLRDYTQEPTNWPCRSPAPSLPAPWRPDRSHLSPQADPFPESLPTPASSCPQASNGSPAIPSPRMIIYFIRTHSLLFHVFYLSYDATRIM